MSVISISSKDLEEIKPDALVIGLARKPNGTLVLEPGLARLSEKSLLASLTDLGATGRSDEVIKVPGANVKILVVTGLGNYHARHAYSHETLRRAAGAAARELAGVKRALFSLPSGRSDQLVGVAEGSLLGAYTFDSFRSASRKDRKSPLAEIVVQSDLAATPAARSSQKRAQLLANAVHLVRDLVNTPPSHLTPISFCAKIKPLAVSAGLKVAILDEVALRKGGYGGIVGVGQGSANPPRLLHLSYLAGRPKARFAYVGKGITFDTGGLNLKPGLGMDAMKSDMGGAAAVVAAAIVIAKLKLPIAIDVWAPLAENMVSDTAQRPSDIVSAYGGRTIEVLNPDAEGRLILADALVRAQEVGKKADGLDALIDVATLTGHQGLALGARISALMGNDDDLSKEILAAAKDSGEDFWPMPLPVELRASLDSPVADIANIGDRFGGMLVAGLFLKEFVEEGVPWAHLDIASPAYNLGEPHGYTPVGGTGVAVRTLVRLAESACGL
ncbi:MAG TPA: leucyl aminopeptidase [Candidatus Nanopelagicaceae bacterium]|nr:leucyl aminopeptidase [Candidatus Nanopelagicaceae bacterium]